jgi:hypothetical protein
MIAFRNVERHTVNVLEEIQHYVVCESCLTDMVVRTNMAHEIDRCAMN